MAFWKIVTLACTASIVVDARLHHQKRDAPSNICDPVYNNTNKVQCYCIKDHNEPPGIKSADCYLTQKNVAVDSTIWNEFNTLKNVHKLVFGNTRGVVLPYVPTEALKVMNEVKKFEIKHANINTIESFAFANLTSLEEITIRDNQIVILDPYSFIHHKNLKKIVMDTNNIVEINRNVFVDLPSLESLYLTNNQISTIHDRAFVHLINLKELEINNNKVFSLNFAVFEGLKNLQKLDLSSNSLEVIGDNTFQALEKLENLNLDGNKIQMLDDKAFNGLAKLQSLSLARNKLTDIDSDKIFEGLESLVSISLKGNQIKELKSTVIAPIINNFYGPTCNLDVEDNNFPCDCRLEWFMLLMNKTQNTYFKNSLENLKCTPDANVKEAWAKADKNAPQDTDAPTNDEQAPTADYEYYDESQLNGKLFYLDVRDLLNCSQYSSNKSTTNVDSAVLTKDNASPVTTAKALAADESVSTIIDNNIKAHEVNDNLKPDKNKREKNEINNQETFATTTTKLATVSAKPVETKIYENMASDEAKPDKIKAHRSVQEKEDTGSHQEGANNKAGRSFSGVMLLIFTIFLRLNL